MSKNINQVFGTNPATAMQNTDLMYLGRFPYGLTNDMAILWSDIVLSIGGDFLKKANNFTDVADPATAFQNLGTGDGTSITITDSDFTLGVYQIPVPFPAQIVCNNLSVPGQEIRLMEANVAFDSPALGQGVILKMINCDATNIALFDGTIIDNLEGFEESRYICNDKSTAAGAYTILPNVYFVNSVSGRVSLFSPENTVYVGTSTSTGQVTGSITNPYPSLSAALAAISPTSIRPYKIIMDTGIYTETNLVLKANVAIEGNQSSLDISGVISLDAGWSAGGFLYIENFSALSLPPTVTLDFIAALAPLAVFIFRNNIMNLAAPTDLTVIGAIFISTNNFGFSNQINYIIDQCYGALQGGASGNIDLTDVGNYSVTGMTEIGNFTVTYTQNGTMSFVHQESLVYGDTVYQSTGPGLLSVLEKGVSHNGDLTLDNGTGGGTTTLSASTLTFLPTLLNGATYAPDSIGDAVRANTYFTPTNYIPVAGPPGQWVADSITGNLAGIDAALVGGGGVNITQMIYVNDLDGNDLNTGSITSPLKTYDAARALAVSRSPSPTKRFIIKVIGDLSLAGDFNINPYIDIDFQDSTVTIAGGGGIALDASWTVSNEKVLITGFRPICASGMGLSWASNTYQNNVVTFLNPNFAQCAFAGFFGTSYSTGGDNEVCIFNDLNPANSSFSGGVTVSDVKSRFNSVNFGGDLSYSLFDDDYNITHFLSNSIVPGTLTINRPIGNSTQTVNVRNTFIGTAVTMTDQFCYLVIDSNSYSKVPTFSGSEDFTNITIYNNTDGIIENTYVPTNYSFVPGNYCLNALTGYLAGIDNALVGGGGVDIEQLIYVNDLNGNDTNTGSITSPLKTYEAARLLAISRGANSNFVITIVIVGAQNITGNMTLSPNICIQGSSPYADGFSVSGSVVIDPNWGLGDFAYTQVRNLYMYLGGGNYTFTFTHPQVFSFLKFVNIAMNDGAFITITGSGTDPSGYRETIVFENCTNDLLNYADGFIAENVDLFLINTDITNGAVTVTASSAVVTGYNLVINNARFYTNNINVVTNNVSTLTTRIESCNTQGRTLTIDGTNNTVIVDSTSYMFTLALAGGATLANLNIPTLSDGMTGNLVPTAYTPTGSATDKATSMTGHLRGIDAAIASLGGGVNIDALIFVSEVSGNDANTGSIMSPLKTYSAAATMALTRSPAYGHEITIVICGALSITGNFVIYPNVNVFGFAGTYSTQVGMSGGLVLSTLWNTASIPQCQINGIQFIAQTMNLNRPVFNGLSFIRFQFCSFQILSAPISINGSGTGPGGECESIIFENCNEDFQIDPVNIIADMVNIYFWNTSINGNLSVYNSSTTGIATCNIQNCPNITGNLTLVALSAVATLTTTISATNTRGTTLTVNGIYNTVYIDSASYQFSGLSLGSGATLSNINFPTNTDGITNANFTPTYYTPTGSGSDKATSLTGNLRGIDAAIGARALPMGYIETTNLTNILQNNTEYTANNASTVSLTLPTSSAVGDKIIVNGKGAGGWRIDQQNAGHVIKFGALSTTTGGTGSLASATQYASITLTCITASNVFVVQASAGTFTLV